jgi:hypothetical protein
MRALLAALALAGALMSFAPAPGSEAAVRVAQMSRDVTDAVRRQRNQKQSQPRWKTR